MSQKANGGTKDVLRGVMEERGRGSLLLSVGSGDAGARGTRASALEAAARRLLDILVSGTALVVLLPLLLVISCLVKLDSAGPILFRQSRVGVDRRRRRNDPASPSERRNGEGFGRPFVLLKFRTMHADAQQRFPELYAYRYSAEELRTIPIKVLVGKKEDAKRRLIESAGSPEREEELGSLLLSDPRVTSAGRWLRRTSLDELPNLLNVLRGDMHLVGPRPDIASNIAYYSDQELEILRVKPGITGLAQVRGRGLLTFEKTNAYDLEYVRKRSLLLDLRILAATIPALVKREGAY